ncbi:NAD(P)-binding domain-containing protein [Ottowia thiooxydans]|uniref:3-hydroxyisobutyrate dehydrogenase n=1 Tax=Ottowia thiooxydans TaxID=219182 RepID=A0ABV2QF56_9BURK
MQRIKFALIGGGVVGQCYGHALVEQGHALLGVWDVHPTPSLESMTETAGAGIFSSAGEWLEDADVVVSAVFGSAALDVAQRALACMRRASLYIDMTTATPQDMALADTEAQQHGVGFVDVAITGAVNLRGSKTPLLCAGKQAGQFVELFRDLGAPIRVVGPKPGDAAQLKLLRSIFAKGLEALTIECLTTAEVAGLRAELHEVLLDIDQMPLQTLMESLVATHIEHAPRRHKEVIEAANLMRANGIEPLVLDGARALFERTAAALELQSAPTGSVQASLQWLIDCGRDRKQMATTGT